MTKAQALSTMSPTAARTAKTKSARRSTASNDGAKAPSAKSRTRSAEPATSKAAAEALAVPTAASAATQPLASKQGQLAALLLRDEGATLDQMIALTGWLPHTTRAALTGLRKKGYGIDSDKVDGIRTYRAVAPR